MRAASPAGPPTLIASPFVREGSPAVRAASPATRGGSPGFDFGLVDEARGSLRVLTHGVSRAAEVGMTEADGDVGVVAELSSSRELSGAELRLLLEHERKSRQGAEARAEEAIRRAEENAVAIGRLEHVSCQLRAATAELQEVKAQYARAQYTRLQLASHPETEMNDRWPRLAFRPMTPPLEQCLGGGRRSVGWRRIFGLRRAEKR